MTNPQKQNSTLDQFPWCAYTQLLDQAIAEERAKAKRGLPELSHGYSYAALAIDRVVRRHLKDCPQCTHAAALELAAFEQKHGIESMITTHTKKRGPSHEQAA